MRQYQDLIVDFGGRDVIQQPEPEETSPPQSLGLRARDRFSRFLFLKQMFGLTGQQETAESRRHSEAPSKEHESGGLRRLSSSVPKQLSSTRSITRGTTKTSSRSSVDRRQNALFNSMISTGSIESGRTESSNTEISIKSSWGEREELRKSQQGPNPFGFF